MSKHLRLSEKWFNRGLWLISIIFASFLIGLGSAVIRDLPKVEKHINIDMFLDQEKMVALNNEHKIETSQLEEISEQLENQRIMMDNANRSYQQAKETHHNWLETRAIVKNSENDDELIERMQELEVIKENLNHFQNLYEKTNSEYREHMKKLDKINQEESSLRSLASEEMYHELTMQSLRVFLYRLLLTLPLLVVAGYLFVKKRKERYWPFTWGFIFFALFAFFVELVPYLPSYGGYVRYGVGIIVTLIAGHYSIRGLQRYLENQKKEEAKPENLRRKEIAYDFALARLSKNICPGCERTIPKDSNLDHDYCPHCGINLFYECSSCHARKSSFHHFCHACGHLDKEIESV